MKKNLNLVLFLCIVIISLYLPAIKIEFVYKSVLIIISIIISIYLYLKNFALFVPTLFFLLNSLLNPVIFYLLNKNNINIPQINFLLPIVIYLIIVLNNKSYKKEITWWKLGKCDRITYLLIFVMVIFSGLCLVLWTVLIKKDLSDYLKFLPDIPFILLILYGITFPAFNSIFEEFLARAVLFDGFQKIFNTIMPVILGQAIIFAVWHFRGFPGGITGLIMVFIWSIFLGIIRHRSKGMLAPLIAHYFADLTIALIILCFHILPNI